MINAQINDPFRKLKSILFSFDVNANEEKKSLIVQLVNTTKPNKVKPLHELLLAVMAYPANEDLLLFTERETRKLLSRLEGKQSLQNKLTGTGLLHTSIACNFSFRNVKYLLSKFPGAISIHSSASAPETQKNILKQLLPDVEYALIHAGDKNLQTRLSRFHSTEQTDLEWLFQTFEQSGLHETIQALLYQQLEVFVHWNISSEKDSISFLRSGLKLNTVYYHTLPPDKKPNAQSIIAKPLPRSVLLSLEEKQNLIHAAKMSLVYLYRETEPFTNANEKDVTLFNLDKGISIALFGSSLNKRYSLESYIGYLVLKNTIPVSYGGGWIFGDRCQFGINILEAFRGGESGLIICELLRVYHQHFKVAQFIVKPYQFGLRNPEAIRTGAFWFYYKLGFRPENDVLKNLALKEAEFKQANPAYKTETATLRRFTKSNLVLSLSGVSTLTPDPEKLSEHITRYIQIEFNGDRKTALNACLKRLLQNTKIDIRTWRKEDLEYARQVALLFCIYPNCDEWQKQHKKQIESFILLKSAKMEMPWIKQLRTFKGFWKMIQTPLSF